ncbi:MAG: hypothetical protein F4103_16660 [Boseongicola sp. SB0673_bin_14]|nr:hypothetical protein [Boseongicola sp. SB0667_bin_21]MYI70293.1 hypothetical protein [Boseongicola sp. SB0673_bin_14]
MTHFNVVVPVEGTDKKTRFRRVGALFENAHSETGEIYYTVQLDFPVGVTKLLAFPPRAEEVPEAAPGAEASGEPAG